MYVENCTQSAITFVVMRLVDVETNVRQINRFEFDFRYYHPYNSGDLKRPGVYVFKTADTNSFSLNHTIQSI
jgi:hypothetical protein